MRILLDIADCVGHDIYTVAIKRPSAERNNMLTLAIINVLLATFATISS